MQNPPEKRRCSILKKRRSRSLSPKSPQREPARRASRRISFSGKHHVREFFTNENTANVWGETYDVSTEKHVLSNEQITFQSTLQVTRNESTVMDISNVAPLVSVDEFSSSKKSSLVQRELKENKNIEDDTDIELTLVFPSSKSNLSLSSGQNQNASDRKKEANETLLGDGYDNMEISGIEPTVSSAGSLDQPAAARSNYRDWLMQQNFIAAPNTDCVKKRLTTNEVVEMHLNNTVDNNVIQSKESRRSIHRVQDIELDASPVPRTNMTSKLLEEKHHGQKCISNEVDMVESPILSTQKITDDAKRNPINRTAYRSIHLDKDIALNESISIEKSIDLECEIVMVASKQKDNDLKVNPGNRNIRRSIHQVQDIELDETPCPEPELIAPSNKRMTINQPNEMSIDSLKLFDSTQMSDMSIELMPSEMKNYPLRRQTTHQEKEISLETSTIEIRMNQPTRSSRLTVNTPKEMSFDSTTASETPTLNNKTVLNDISMDLQKRDLYTPARKSVICKSPGKNKTTMFDDSFEMTSAVRGNCMYQSFNPLHSTKIHDSSKFAMNFETTRSENKTIHTNLPMDESYIAENVKHIPIQTKSSAKQIQINLFRKLKPSTVFVNEANVEMNETDSPVPTAKKYNLNKTPFFSGLDKENDPALIETMNFSASSLDITNKSKEHDYIHGVNYEKQMPEMHRKTELFYTTIGDDSNIESQKQYGTDQYNMEPIVISDDSSSEPNVITPTISENRRRKTCVQEISMVVEQTSAPKKSNNIMTQSILQLTPIQRDVLIDVKPGSSRLTVLKNDSTIESDPSPRYSIGIEEESKQLTFIDDDDDESDHIWNTKMELASSLDGSEIHDFVDRKRQTIDNSSYSVGPFCLSNENSAVSFPTNSLLREPELVSSHAQRPSLSDDKKTIHELMAFKKSNRLRHSNVFGIDSNIQNESLQEKTQTENGESAMPSVSMDPISRSSIMKRRSSVASNVDTTEMSYLSKSTFDKPANEIKLDFSGYEKFAGLATPKDVLHDFKNRMDQIHRNAKMMEEQRNKFEHGEIENLDSYNNNNVEDLISQNIDAPSWTFLYKNKMKWEDEQRDVELQRRWDDRLVGAYLPVIPSASILIMNKCRELKNWIFDDIWFFAGNIHLRNKMMPAFKVCLVYDPTKNTEDIELYGAMKFNKINKQFCTMHINMRDYAGFKLKLQELNHMLPSNLLSLCETSAHLSEFDDKLHTYCLRVTEKITELYQLCHKNSALIKAENDSIYILKAIFKLNEETYQDYIIELGDIDNTSWRDVRTNPPRVLNEEIKHLSKGMEFIKEFLSNDSKYVPLQ